MQIQEEIKVDHKDRCSGVPIKKRLFHLSQCSFSPSQETCSTSHNYQRQPNQFSVEAESSVSVKDAGLPLDTGTSPKDFVNSSSASSGQRYGSDVHANHDDMELKKATIAFKESNMEEDLNADNRPSLGLDMDKGKQLSQPGTWEMIIVDRTMEEKIATCDVSAFRVETTSIVHLSSSKDNKYHGYNSSKQEIVKTCSLDLHQTMHNEVDSEYGSADRCVSRENWDLNVPMEVWEANLSDSVVEHVMDHRLNHSAMHPQNIDRCLIQPTLGTIASASTSGTSMVERSQYKPRLRNLRTPADDKRGYEGGLDLQLRPPSRPELRINWGKIAPSDLSLSLTGNLSEVSCGVVKPEHCENSNQKVTEVSQHSSLKSVGIRHVKSEPCDENVHGEASSVAVLFDQESSLGRVLKSEPPEEPKEKPPSLESDDNRQLTCCTDVSPSQVKPALNSNAVVDANILNDNNPVMPGNAKIKSGESTLRALDPAELSGSDVLYKADNVLTNICANQGAEGNTSKSVDIIADPISSDAKESNANMTESREIADVASALHHESASYLIEPMAHDDMSEGSAEMDCSDNEDYTSSKLVAGDDLHMATDINNVPSATNQEGLGLPAEIQTEQFNSNEQQFDATYNLRFTTNVTIPVDGDVEVKGGELGDPVPQCVSEVSCDHEEKRVPGNVLECSNELPCEYEKKVHENATTDFTGSDGHAVMMGVHSDTKGKQIVSEEAMGLHRAESFDVSMCRDKKEMSSDLTTVLHEPPDNGVVRVYSSKRLAKPCPEAIKNHLGKEKGSEMKSNSIRPPNAIAKTMEDNVDRQQMRTRYAIASIKHPELPERDSDVSGIGNKHVDDAGKHSHEKNVDSRCKHRQITKVSSPAIRSFGQRKPISSRSISSGTEDGLIDKQRRHTMFSQGRRCSGFESKKNQDQSTDECDSDYTNTARHSNRHLDRNSNTLYASEHNNSRKHQFSRLSKRSEVPLEVATNGSVGSASTLSRRPMGDQPYRSSCFPLWPRHQEEPPLVDTRNARCLVRDVSPNREEIMRTLRHEMVDSILYSHPTMEYGPTENDVLPRGSNISPTRRRPPPLHFYGMGSPRRWLSPGRSPEMVMNKQHPALVRHGAPPSVDMSNSPHGHLYFPEGMMVERNALPGDMDEMLPVNDLDLPRPGGFLQRNTRRYDFGPHETAADYLGPVHFFADHFIDTRNHHDGRDNLEHTTLPYHVEDARHIRSSRDFDSQARDRHGNARNRLRSIVEQGEGHRCCGEQGWRDGGLHSKRLKRRKP